MRSLSFKNYVKFDPEDLSEPDRDAPEIEKQFSEICAAIQENLDLECINLSGNSLSEFHFGRLATALNPHRNLVMLSLEYNRINLASIPYLKQIIKEHPKLTRINMDFNELDDEALIALITDVDAEYIERLKTIKFRFYDNQITEKGIEAAINKLSPDSLETSVCFNKVNKKAEERLEKLIELQRASLKQPQCPNQNSLPSGQTAASAKSPLILSGSPAQTKKDSYEHEEKTQSPERKVPAKK